MRTTESDTLPSALADELSCVAAWLDKEAAVAPAGSQRRWTHVVLSGHSPRSSRSVDEPPGVRRHAIATQVASGSVKWFLLLALWERRGVVASCLAVLLGLHRMRRRNRVRPTEPDDVPIVLAGLAPAPRPGCTGASSWPPGRSSMVAERHRPVGRRPGERNRRPSSSVRQLEAHAASLDAHLAFERDWRPPPAPVLANLAPG